MQPTTVAILLAGTVFLIAVSWRSLGRRRSHGFYRFFAFEAILGIVALNAPRWFDRPLTPLHLASWALLVASLVLAVHGFALLRMLGRPVTPDPDSPLWRVENTTSLVTVGAYRLIRHPLYASLLYLAWGAALKALSPLTAALALAASVSLVATAKVEEGENLSRFGPAYREYMAHTRLFVPFVL